MDVMILSLILLTNLVYSLGEPCVWPDWFDVSGPGAKWLQNVNEYSWETEAIIDSSIYSMINWYIKSKKTVTILNNNTMRITSWQKDNRAGNGTLYECEQNFGNSKYLLKKTGIETTFRDIIKTPESYRCMELLQRSRFVAQWRLGPETSQPPECQGDFAPISPWPLVYFPVRDLHKERDIWKREDLFKDYPRCPPLGGFLMKVYEENGNPIINNECKNDYPSSRIEMECVDGEGIVITPSDKCRRYSTGDRLGAKFHCLANWEDNKYQYSLLMPNDASGVHIFHCLKMNKTNPTSGNAILFLDTLCREGDPQPSDNYFRINLRRHSTKGICVDLSDQCNPAQCHNMQNWCTRTCNAACSNVLEPIVIDESIRGTWMLHEKAKQTEFLITNKTIKLSGMGTFHAYANLSQERRMCLPARDLLNENTFEYALAREGDGEGCGPRVTQFRARRISESVLILQAPGTAPLRPNKYFTNPTEWCHNNYQDADWYASVFTPHWPYVSAVQSFSYGTGTFTLINNNKITSIQCSFLPEHLQSVINHMKVKIELSSGGQYNCNGESHVKDDTYTLSYTCNNGPSDTITYQCLASYRISDDYQSVILKAPKSTSDNKDGIAIHDGFYCLLVPTEPRKKHPWFYSTAGECDLITGSAFYTNSRDPLATITPVTYLVINGSENLTLNQITVFIIMIAYVLFSH